jgi:cation transport ATPase
MRLVQKNSEPAKVITLNSCTIIHAHTFTNYFTISSVVEWINKITPFPIPGKGHNEIFEIVVPMESVQCANDVRQEHVSENRAKYTCHHSQAREAEWHQMETTYSPSERQFRVSHCVVAFSWDWKLFSSFIQWLRWWEWFVMGWVLIAIVQWSTATSFFSAFEGSSAWKQGNLLMLVMLWTY